MKSEDIMRLALEAEMAVSVYGVSTSIHKLGRFAALVATEKDKEIEQLRGEVEGLRWAYNTVTDDCRNLTEKVIPNIRSERDAAVARVRDYEDDYRAVVNEQCAGDEKHCTCVPHLRTEIERLRGEVARLDKACQYHANNASELGRSLENLEHDYAAMKAERDAALALLRELVETRDKHYVYQTNDVMPRWDERVAAAIDAARGSDR